MRLAPMPLAVAAFLAVAAVPPAEAQLDRIRRRVQRAAEDEVGRKAEQMTRDAIRCAVGDTACAERARKAGKTAVFTDASGELIVDENGKPVTDPKDAARTVEQPGSEVWRNYDFVPGNTVWYALDLAAEPVGRFPASQLTFVSGNAQVVERNGARVLEITAPTTVVVPLARALPDDFTVELDVQASAPNAAVVLTTTRTESRNLRVYPGHYLYLYQVSGIARQAAHVSSQPGLWHIGSEVVSFKFQVDGGPKPADDYAILYAGSERVAQLPSAEFPRGNAIEVFVPATKARPAYLANLVVAVHGDPLYDALRRDGQFTTRGILFDFDSDRLRPESTPTLEQLHQALTQHADLAVTIEGHTDAQGDAAYNQKLSERRATAVVDYLVGRGIDATRLAAVGKGEAVPVAGNDTEADRQQNRRVVIIKRP
ncbi:MAG: OmpA family protein [Gemmatimonadales bacterium]|nr:OmpA family protein [Gemmatimonadales bacterium]